MSNNERDPVHVYGYFDDRGNEWAMELTESKAAIGGFVALQNNAASGLPLWFVPRHVGAVATDGSAKRTTFPIADLDSTRFLSPDLFAYSDRNWSTTGRTGEKFRIAAFAG